MTGWVCCHTQLTQARIRADMGGSPPSARGPGLSSRVGPCFLPIRTVPSCSAVFGPFEDPHSRSVICVAHDDEGFTELNNIDRPESRFTAE